MALTDENTSNGFYMPVAPAYGGNNGGFFGNGGDWAWILLLLLIGGGGWGFGGLGGGMMWPMMMGAGMGGFGIDYLYPWLNNSEHISNGFKDQQLSSAVSGLQTSVVSGFGDVQNSLCAGFAGVNQNLCQTGNAITGAINNGFASAEIAANGRQMANMQQLFGIQSAQQQCCCDNKAGLADLKYTLATEACATRAANTANTQSILDKLCQLELDNYKTQLEAKNDLIAQLRQENLYARGQASQVAQTADIRANNATVANQLLSEMRSCPIPSQPVYGNQPIFSCGGNTVGCGCGA